MDIRELTRWPIMLALMATVTAVSCADGSDVPMDARGAHEDVVRGRFSYGAQSVGIAVPRRFFTAANLPIPDGDEIEAMTLVVDRHSGEPSASSVSESPDVIAIQYRAFVPEFIDRFVDPDHPNYYTKYRVESEFAGLRRLDVVPNAFQSEDQQDRSFILIRHNDALLRHDLLIECQQYNESAPALPCLMFQQLANGVVAEVRFAPTLISEWRSIEQAVGRLSAELGIDEELSQ